MDPLHNWSSAKWSYWNQSSGMLPVLVCQQFWVPICHILLVCAQRCLFLYSQNPFVCANWVYMGVVQVNYYPGNKLCKSYLCNCMNLCFTLLTLSFSFWFYSSCSLRPYKILARHAYSWSLTICLYSAWHKGDGTFILTAAFGCWSNIN